MLLRMKTVLGFIVVTGSLILGNILFAAGIYLIFKLTRWWVPDLMQAWWFTYPLGFLVLAGAIWFVMASTNFIQPLLRFLDRALD